MQLKWTRAKGCWQILLEGLCFLPAAMRRLAFYAGVGEFLTYFCEIFYEFMESLISIFMLGLLADTFSIGINNKIENIDPRGHMMFSDFYSDFIDFHGSFSEQNSY
ncbi:MAG: hypothetical protein ACI8PD_000098 [Nitrospinales bacterium]|jgi:hypothetical protein